MGKDDECADAHGRREHDVLERSEPQDADAGLPPRDARPSERDEVGREAPMCDEDAEPREDDRGQLRESELRAALDARHLTVGEHVAEVGDDLARQRERDPDQVRMRKPVEDVPEAGSPGDGHGRSECEREPQSHEERDLPCGVVEMALRPKP